MEPQSFLLWPRNCETKVTLGHSGLQNLSTRVTSRSWKSGHLPLIQALEIKWPYPSCPCLDGEQNFVEGIKLKITIQPCGRMHRFLPCLPHRVHTRYRYSKRWMVQSWSSSPRTFLSSTKYLVSVQEKMNLFIVLNIGRDYIPLIKYLRSSTHGQSTSMLPIMSKWSVTLPLWLKGCQTFSCPNGASVLPSSYLEIFRHLPLIKKVSYVACVIKQISYIQIFRPNRFQA